MEPQAVSKTIAMHKTPFMAPNEREFFMRSAYHSSHEVSILRWMAQLQRSETLFNEARDVFSAWIVTLGEP